MFKKNRWEFLLFFFCHFSLEKRAQILGNKVEMDIANTLAQNTFILRVGVHFNTLGPRAKVQDALKRNWDRRNYHLFYLEA
jgi:hypothetical protein